MDLTINADKLLRVNEETDEEDIFKHYNVTRAMVEESVQKLKEWYTMQPHLPQGALDDRKLLRHLGMRGFSIERTKEKIDHYYSARHAIADLTTNRDPKSKHIQKALDVVEYITLPQKTPENHRVTIFRFKILDPSEANIWDIFKVSFMIADYRLENDLTVGEQIVINLSDIRMGHVMQATPSLITKSNFYTQRCIGAKIKGVHLVGLPSYAETMINMFKLSIPKKIAGRIYTYEKFEDLKNILPVNILPKDMGGKDISSEEIHKTWRETLESPAWRQWFIDQDNLKTDESKRPKNSVTAEDLMGLHGSFRKLDLD